MYKATAQKNRRERGGGKREKERERQFTALCRRAWRTHHDCLQLGRPVELTLCLIYNDCIYTQEWTESGDIDGDEWGKEAERVAVE